MTQSSSSETSSPTSVVSQALEGLNFPCDRTRVVDFARRHHADTAVIAALKTIPDRQYADQNDVVMDLRRSQAPLPPPEPPDHQEVFQNPPPLSLSGQETQREILVVPWLLPMQLWWEMWRMFWGR